MRENTLLQSCMSCICFSVVWADRADSVIFRGGRCYVVLCMAHLSLNFRADVRVVIAADVCADPWVVPGFLFILRSTRGNHQMWCLRAMHFDLMGLYLVVSIAQLSARCSTSL